MASTIEQIARTDAGLAAALRIAVARLTRRLRSERDPRNERGRSRGHLERLVHA